jgi:hypothetical protein
MRAFSRGLLPLLGLLAGTATAATAAESPSCDYRIRLQENAGLELVVDAACSFGSRPVFARPAMAEALPDFVAGEDGHSLHYRLRLDRLAAKTGNADDALRIDDAIISPISAWLADPGLPDAEITLAIETGSGLDYAVNLPQRGDRLHLRRDDIRFGGYAMFGRFERQRIAVGDAVIEAVGIPGRIRLPEAVVQEWISDSAQAVSRYFGGFPLARTLIVIAPVPDRGSVVFGRVRGGGGGTILLQLGTQVQKAALYDDWILVHEMIHLSAPFLTGRSSWVMEGMATYLEPLIRTQAGWRSATQLWQEFTTDMPRGMQGLTVESLDSVSRAGLYWGGAIFMLLADLDMRQGSGGKASLQTCLQAVLHQGGDTTQRWSRERFFSVCDAATGTGTMAKLNARYAQQPSALDLAALWRDLGISNGPGGIRFDDTAPLAHLRRAIVSGS